MSFRRPAALALAVPLLASLAACGPETQRSFGFTRDPPDEFQVTTRAPLSLPPALGALPTPRPGAERPQELSPRQAAEATLVPSSVLTAPAGGGRRSGGETALLSQAGQPVSGDIRRRLDAEASRLDRPDRGLVDRLMFWRGPDAAGTPLDARREAQRLRENAALGRPPTEGETPVIQRTGNPNPFLRVFEGIF